MVDASEMGERVGRIQVLKPDVQQLLLTLFNRAGAAPKATLVENSRIHANDEAWQPNQYLKVQVDAGTDLKNIRAEVKAARETLNLATKELDTAMSQLGPA